MNLSSGRLESLSDLQYTQIGQEISLWSNACVFNSEYNPTKKIAKVSNYSRWLKRPDIKYFSIHQFHKERSKEYPAGNSRSEINNYMSIFPINDLNLHERSANAIN